MDSKKLGNWRKNTVRLFQMLIKYNGFLSILWTFCILIAGVLPLFTVILNKQLINNLTEISNIGMGDNLIKIITILLLIALVSISQSLFSNMEEHFYNKMHAKIQYYLESRLNEKLSKFPSDLFEKQDIYNSIVLARDAIQTDGLKMINSFAEIVTNTITVISVLTTLIVIHWALPVSIALSTIPSFFIVVLIKKLEFKQFLELIERKRKNDYLSSLFSMKDAIKEFKIFGMGDYLLKHWGNEYNEIQRIELKLDLKEKILNIIGIVIIQITVLCASLFLAYLIGGGDISLGDYVALISATSILQSSLAQIGAAFSELYEINMYITALFKVLDEPIDFEQPFEEEALKEELIDTISLNAICYKYPQSKTNVLKNISFNITKGDKIALIGYNGSGKTTLANIIMGIYENYEGKISVNGKELNSCNIQEYRNKVTCVLQNFLKYELSIRENIAFGNIDLLKQDEEIKNMIDKVYLDSDLKNNLDQYLFAGYEGGTELSGGEWQKIAIARAAIKNSEIVIFDEPTAALDPNAELKMYQLLMDLAQDKICIIISHRLGAVKFCNRVISMQNGEVVEDGTPNELIRRKGLYSTFYQEQASLYNW